MTEITTPLTTAPAAVEVATSNQTTQAVGEGGQFATMLQQAEETNAEQAATLMADVAADAGDAAQVVDAALTAANLLSMIEALGGLQVQVPTSGTPKAEQMATPQSAQQLMQVAAELGEMVATPTLTVTSATISTADVDELVIPAAPQAAQATAAAEAVPTASAIAPLADAAIVEGDAAATPAVTPAPATTQAEASAKSQTLSQVIAGALSAAAEETEGAASGTDAQAVPAAPSQTPVTKTAPAPTLAPTPVTTSVSDAALADEAPSPAVSGQQTAPAPVKSADAAQATPPSTPAAAPGEKVKGADAPEQTTQGAAVQVAATETDKKTVKAQTPAAERALAADTDTMAEAPVKVAVKAEEKAAPASAVHKAETPAQAPAMAASAAHMHAASQSAVHAELAPQTAEGIELPAAPQPQQATTPVSVHKAETPRPDQSLLLQAWERVDIEKVAQQLLSRLNMSRAAEGHAVQLRLHPRELGDMDVSMKIVEGLVTATIAVERPEATKALEGRIEDLRKSLEAQGLKLDSLEVGVRQHNGGANAEGSEQGSRSSTTGAQGTDAGTLVEDVTNRPNADDLHDGAVSVLA